MKVAGKTFHEGDWLSIDGTTVNDIDGRLSPCPRKSSRFWWITPLILQIPYVQCLLLVMAWADAERRLEGSHQRRPARSVPRSPRLRR
jgi:hypothetical protein